jgi:ABC-type lipoprotein export system ATPase subunit
MTLELVVISLSSILIHEKIDIDKVLVELILVGLKMGTVEIRSITIEGGVGKDNTPEPVHSVKLCMGDIISIVGHTGSGKTRLINDIEMLANKNTPSMRRILINDIIPSEEFFEGPAKNPVALITQHTNFLADMAVERFLETHAQIREQNSGNEVSEVMDFANQLTGESIELNCSMTELSGGQTRSLLIADAVLIGNSPIILLDEIENAGIHRTKALELLRKYRKIFVFVTHDPRIALLSDRRIVMKEGAMVKLVNRNAAEENLAESIKKIDDVMSKLRDKLRNGETLDGVNL